MPQIGWLEILIIVVIAILIIGPKDFPAVLNKIGSTIGSIKRYFSDIQQKVSKIEENFDDVGFDEKENKKKIDKKNEN